MGQAIAHKALKWRSPPLFFTPRNFIKLRSIKLLKNHPQQPSKHQNIQKCLNITSAVISTLLTCKILLTTCGIIARSQTKIRKFWPGYLHLNPRHGTTTSEPVGSMRWENGSSKLRNIGIGSVVFVVVVDLMVQPCFVTEVRELARPTLGKREDTRGKEGIANRLRY